MGSGRYNRHQECLKSGQERIQDYFFRFQERARALQEVFKRVPEGFCVEDAIQTLFWNHFGGQKREPGTSKIIKILAKIVKNQGFAILSLDRFLTSILGPSWFFFWEGIWCPSHPKLVSKVTVGRPRAVP